jgi:hypothetical protein
LVERARSASGLAGAKHRRGEGEQIAKEQVMEMHPVLRGFFGAE